MQKQSATILNGFKDYDGEYKLEANEVVIDPEVQNAGSEVEDIFTCDMWLRTERVQNVEAISPPDDVQPLFEDGEPISVQYQ